MRRHAKASSAGPISGRDGHLRPLLAAVLALLVLAFSGQASAAPIHPYKSQISEANGSPFANPWGLAVDDSGNLWVSDVGHGLIDKFDTAGSLLAQGDGDGNWQSQRAQIKSLSFGNSANRLYIADSQSTNLWALTSDANFDFHIDGPWEFFNGGEHRLNTAVDNSGGASDGYVYLSAREYEDEAPGVYRVDDLGNAADFSASAPYIEGNRLIGTPDHSLFANFINGPAAVAVDNEGNLYVVDYSHKDIDKFDPSGAFVQSFAEAGKETGPESAIAIDPTSGNILVTTEDRVREFNAAGDLVGELSGSNTPAGSFLPGEIAVDANGTVYVADRAHAVVDIFGPVVSLPVSVAKSVSDLTPNSTTLGGSIDPDGLAITDCHFEYVNHADFEANAWANATNAPCISNPGSGDDPVDVSAEISNLNATTKYHFRVSATNSNGVARSLEQVFETPANVKDVTTGTATDISTNSATLGGNLDPDGSAITDCHFEYVGDAEFQENAWANAADVPCSSDPPIVSEAVEVSAEVTGLEANTVYHFRLSATNVYGTSVGLDQTFITFGPPIVTTTAAAPRTDVSARINGSVNPRGDSTTYYFEFGSSQGYGQSLPITQDADAGAGTEPIVVSEEVTGLQPGTTYHYRIVAENQRGPQLGSDITFTTRTAAEMELPQRGIEMISSPDKGEQNVSDASMAPDGNHARWSVLGGAPGATSGAGNTYLATRTAQGWQSLSMVPPAANQAGQGDLKYNLIAASADLSTYLYETTSGFVASAPYAFARVNGIAGTEQTLATFTTGNTSIPIVSTDYTEDLAHVLYSAPQEADEHYNQIYDYGLSPPEPVSLMNNDTPPPCGVRFAQQFYKAGVEGEPAYHWIATTNASRVYFLTSNADCSASAGLYVRNRLTDTTAAISTPLSGQDFGANFIRASQDGRSAIFQTRNLLTSDDKNKTQDIYRYSEGSGTACLTCSIITAAPEEIAVSEDLSYIYFISQNALIPGRGIPSSANLYALHNGQVHYVAGRLEAKGFGAFHPTRRRLSLDGHILTFMAVDRASTTTDSLGTGCPNECAQIYRYDTNDTSLECISCTKAGVSETDTGEGDYELSEDGNTVVFRTSAALVRGDVNRVDDIYEWHNGSIGLVSDGVTKWPKSESLGFTANVRIKGLSSDARNIGFTVAAPITGFEHDGLAAFYDARVDGGFHPPTPPAECHEDSCQGPLHPAPTAINPGSTAFSGPGDQSSQRRHKGKKRAQKRKKRHGKGSRRQAHQANPKAGRQS